MTLEQNIVLTGFMGAGKTTVGRLVAERLGWPFVDMDELIVRRAGKPIPRIFAEDGEPAFRALEAAVCQELREPAGLVIATGGGAAVTPANREALAAGGVLICLHAEPETLLRRIGLIRRIGNGDARPILAAAEHSPGGDLRLDRIRELLAQRAPAYAALSCHLDTTDLPIPAVAERVLGIAAMLPEGGHRLPVGGAVSKISPDPGTGPATGQHGAGGYDVLIARGLLAEAGRRIVTAGRQPGPCAVVTNPTVAAHHGAALLTSLREAGFEPLLFEVPDGESHKTLASVEGLYARLAEAGLGRDAAVISLGGGVVGDLAGFVAATWLRGVPFVQIPTSLLAMVDASVGGKVGVDLPQGKNLVGAFKQPALVLIDPELLNTLPAVEFRAGMAEVLKAAIVGDPALFERLATNAGRKTNDEGPCVPPEDLVRTIADAVRVKVRIVERDPFETGDRAWLNLGHTFAHALELISGYTLRHGEAVALGLVAAAELSAASGYCDPRPGRGPGLPGRLRGMLERLSLPVRYRFDPVEALAAMGSDKKRRGRALRFVLIRRIGQVEVVEGVSGAAVLAALETIVDASARHLAGAWHL